MAWPRWRRAGGLLRCCSLLRCSSIFNEADYSIVPATATIDDTRPSTVSIAEKEEVVSDEFHLEQRLVDRHRLGLVELLPDHERPVPLHCDGHDLIVIGRTRIDVSRTAVAASGGAAGIAGGPGISARGRGAAPATPGALRRRAGGFLGHDLVGGERRHRRQLGRRPRAVVNLSPVTRAAQA